MIHSDEFGGFEIFCDYCDEESEIFDTCGDWQYFIQEAKEYGWKMLKIDGEWKHKCPVCVHSVSFDEDY